jgi:hypothetical protein
MGFDGDLLIPILAILVGGTAFIIPVLGFTARFALKPLVESWTKLREAPLADERLQMMERRVSLLEEQVQSLERENHRLVEEADFRMQLGSPGRS